MYRAMLAGVVLGVLTLAAFEPTPGELILHETFAQVPDGDLPPGWRGLDGKWRVENGRLVGEATAYLSRLFAPAGELTDVALEAEVSFLAVKNPSRWLSLMVRAEEGGAGSFLLFTSRFERHRGSGLEIGANLATGDKREWDIYRRGAQAPALSLGDTQRMRVEVRSGFVRAYLDGALVLACELPRDAPAGGEVGLVVSDATASFADLRIERLPPMGREEREDAILATSTLPLIVAHRGASRDFPENTLLAFRKGFEQGADGVEMDVRLSRDGHAYLLHDSTLDRTTNGEGAANEKTLAELQALDAGSWKDAAFAGERIPSFAEAAAELRGRGLIYLDLKENGMGAALAAVLRREDMLDQIVAMCWNLEQVEDIRKHLPEVPILKLGEVANPMPADFSLHWRRQGCDGFALAHSSLTPDFMRQAAAAGMGVHTWTVNSPTGMREVLRLGVGGIITDVPLLARQEVRRLLAEIWLAEQP